MFNSQTKAVGLYLCHHGIKGQKWGVRRFQNEDGSLTNTGKKRYGQRFVDKDGNLTAKGLEKQSRIDRKINDAKNQEKILKKDIRDFDRNKEMYNDPKQVEKATDHAMKRTYGSDRNKKEYLEQLEEMPYVNIRKKAYDDMKNFYNNSNYKEDALESLNYTQNWLRKYGDLKITDLQTKKDYKKFVSVFNNGGIY